MTAFGTDDVQPDLSGKFKFTRPKFLTTMLFWTSPKNEPAESKVLVPEHKYTMSTMRHTPKRLDFSKSISLHISKILCLFYMKITRNAITDFTDNTYTNKNNFISDC